MTPSQAAGRAARESYGRLLAWLAWQWRDIAAAEDALGDAFAAALANWPRDGVPASPEAWLMTAAKHQLGMAARRRKLADDPTLTVLWPNEDTPLPEAPGWRDDRLRLMFVCAHPAIDASIRSALMLQTVLGIDAARIGGACLVPADTMGKRLSRAKAKIRQAGIRFEDRSRASGRSGCRRCWRPSTAPTRCTGVPPMPRPAAHWPARRSTWRRWWPHSCPRTPRRTACWRCCRSASRAARRRTTPPAPSCRWAGKTRAAGTRRSPHRPRPACGTRPRCTRPGPLQIEAAIQLAHASRARTGRTPWADIVVLYERLLAHWPTVGAQIAHAVALAQARRLPEAGLALLDAMDAAAVRVHQPWWAARAHLLAMAGADAQAAMAFDAALALTGDERLRRHLAACRDVARLASGGSV